MCIFQIYLYKCIYTWSLLVFCCFKFSVLTSKTCLKSVLILASFACNATTMLEECDSKCFPLVFLRWDLDISWSRAICWFSELRSPLIIYVNSWISTGRSSKRDFRLATENENYLVKTKRIIVKWLTQGQLFELRICAGDIFSNMLCNHHEFRVALQLLDLFGILQIYNSLDIATL